MSILDQLGLDKTYFYQLAIIGVTFLVLRVIYLSPFLKLFEARHKKTVEDQQNAEALAEKAKKALEEYRQRLLVEQKAAQALIESNIQSAKQEEAKIIAAAREEAKKIISASAEQMAKQRQELERALEFEVESLAKSVTDKLLSKKGGA